MAKRWKKEEITYLRRYAKKKTLLELTERYGIEAEAVETKLIDLGLQTVDGRGMLNLADDPVVQLYEQGLKAVEAGKWGEAKRLFRKVVAEGDMIDLVHRAEQYLDLAERESDKAARPDDPYLQAVLSFNAGDLDAAEAACKREGRMEKDDRFAYLAAVVAASREDLVGALDRLAVAVDLNPRNLIQARQDIDLAALRETPEFAELLG